MSECSDGGRDGQALDDLVEKIREDRAWDAPEVTEAVLVRQHPRLTHLRLRPEQDLSLFHVLLSYDYMLNTRKYSYA